MKSPPRVTTSHQRQFTVAAEDLVSLSPGQLDPVFSTPRLVWHVEETALELLGQYVDDDEVSVGVTVDVAHVAAALQGQEVVCEAQVVHVDGPTVVFHVEARENDRLLRSGVHRRRVVRTARLQNQLERMKNR